MIYVGFHESPARVIRTSKSAYDLGESAGPLQFYVNETPRICDSENDICFGKSAGANDAGEKFAQAHIYVLALQLGRWALNLLKNQGH